MTPVQEGLMPPYLQKVGRSIIDATIITIKAIFIGVVLSAAPALHAEIQKGAFPAVMTLIRGGVIGGYMGMCLGSVKIVQAIVFPEINL